LILKAYAVRQHANRIGSLAVRIDRGQACSKIAYDPHAHLNLEIFESENRDTPELNAARATDEDEQLSRVNVLDFTGGGFYLSMEWSEWKDST
jgi:hypothetical protein